MAGEKPIVIRVKKVFVNKLLGRRQMLVDVVHPGEPAVKKEKLRGLVSQKYKVDERNVVLFGFKTQFGGGKSTGFCLIYDGPESLVKYEPLHRLRRVEILDKRV